MLRKGILAFSCIIVYCLLSALLTLFYLKHPSLKEIVNQKKPANETYVAERQTDLTRDEMADDSERTLSCGTKTVSKKRNSIWNLAEVVRMYLIAHSKPRAIMNVIGICCLHLLLDVLIYN